MNRVYIGLGSNLANPQRQILQAIAALKALPKSRFVLHTPIVRTAPWGGVRSQPDYYNTIAVIDTQLSPQILLTQCQTIERRQKRVRKVRWGARTIDIDLLFYGERTVNTPTLTLPHPQIFNRPFITDPLIALGRLSPCDIRLTDPHLF